MHCFIIAGSPEASVSFIKSKINSDFVICADRGYSFAKAAGISPNLIVGDFDSCKGELPDDCEIVTLPTEKDDTDTAHAVGLALERGYDEITILGAVGGRLDHSLANLCLLAHISSKGGRGELLSEKERIVYLAPGEHSFDSLTGRTFSLFPFGCPEVEVEYLGAKYSDGIYCLTSEKPQGVSNIFSENYSIIRIYRGSAVLIINTSDAFL